MPPVSSRRRFLRRATAALRRFVASGATMTSVRIAAIFSAAGRVQRAVHRDDAAEGRDRIAAQCQIPRLGQRGGAGDAAGIGVLDDRDGGGVEFGDAFECGVGVVEVVVGQFLALTCRAVATPGRVRR